MQDVFRRFLGDWWAPAFSGELRTMVPQAAALPATRKIPIQVGDQSGSRALSARGRKK
jgi:hypothetical protein